MIRNILIAGLGFVTILMAASTFAAPLPKNSAVPVEQQAVVEPAQTQTQQITEPVAETKTETVQTPPIASVAQPVTWQVTSPVGGVSAAVINQVLAHMQAKGLTKEGAAYLTGNFISESGLNPDTCHGDGGTACGIGQWRGDRQIGMPAGLIAQIDWALDVEMPQHASRAGYACLCDMVKTNRINLITNAIKNWEVYGQEGYRYQYGTAIYNQL